MVAQNSTQAAVPYSATVSHLILYAERACVNAQSSSRLLTIEHRSVTQNFIIFGGVLMELTDFPVILVYTASMGYATDAT